jgi:hypothetical protein
MKIATREKLKKLWLKVFLIVSLLNLPVYIYAINENLKPNRWYFVQFLTYLALFRHARNPLSILKNPISQWVFIYILILIGSHLFFGSTDYGRIEVIYGLYFAIFAYTAIGAMDEVNLTNKELSRLLCGIMLIGTVSVFLRLDRFVVSGMSEDRWAGLYINSNGAASYTVLILVTILLLNSVSGLVQTTLSLLASAVVVLSQSRSGMVLYVVAMVSIVVYRNRKGKSILRLAAIAFVGLTISYAGFPTFEEYLQQTNEETEYRIRSITGMSTRVELVGKETRYIALLDAIQKFNDRPFTGWGPGYTREWTESIGIRPHNTLVMQMAEYGMLGVLLVPSFLLCAIRSNIKASLFAKTLYVVIQLLVFMFSHNAFEEALTILLPFFWLRTQNET